MLRVQSASLFRVSSPPTKEQEGIGPLDERISMVMNSGVKFGLRFEIIKHSYHLIIFVHPCACC